MARWTDTGHAMRRRMGEASNHHEEKGRIMARNHMTPEEVISSAEHANSARRYVGQSVGFVSPSAAPAAGKLMPKKNTQAADPTAGGKANRTNMLAGTAEQSERMGARYRTMVKFAPSVDPTAGPTMANAKMVRSVAGRQAPNFDDGMNSVR
jgi:hypothetical protein